MGSDFGSGSCQSVRLGPPDLTTTSCKHFCSSAIMGKADQARLLFTESESEDYETLKTKREKLSSCCKELRKLRRLVIGGHKGLAADTVEAKETVKKELKTDITKLKKRVKTAFGKAYYKIIKNSVPTSRSQCSSNRIGCRETQKEKGCLLRSRREPGLQQGNTKRKRQLH